jgi:uncharacterized membrane protein (UPF0127 family)
MNTRQRILLVVGLLTLVTAGAVLAFPPAQLVEAGDYDRTQVTIVDESGTELATVDARIADTPDKRYTGLRRTENLSDGEGMFFVHGSDGQKPYVMPPSMNFPLDIIFIAPNGTIREIQYADVPTGDNTLRYPGNGKYVLEVPRGYTNRTCIDPGDRVRIPENYSEPAAK